MWFFTAAPLHKLDKYICFEHISVHLTLTGMFEKEILSGLEL